MAKLGRLLAAIVAGRAGAGSAAAIRGAGLPDSRAGELSVGIAPPQGSQVLKSIARLHTGLAAADSSLSQSRGVVLLQVGGPTHRSIAVDAFAAGAEVERNASEVPDLLSSSGSTSQASFLETTWHRWSPPPTLRRKGYEEFFYSAALFDWCVFSIFIAAVLLVRGVFLVGAPSYHAAGLLVSMLLAACYFVAVWTQLGHQSGKDWLAGYMLELTFMVENIFIFSLVIHSLRVPPEQIPKALLCVVVGQILFELVFFMGLAAWLRSIPFLPYALGVWLLCCGASCFYEHQHTVDDEDSDTFILRTLRSICGDRCYVSRGKCGERSCNDSRQEAVCLTLVVCVLLLVDFFLEIDVVLMKIETFPNGYIAFTSSAMAAVALPEMFVVGEALLHKFHYLKKGIAVVLMIFGIQLLLCTTLKFVLPPLFGCVLIMVILVLSIAASALRNRCKGETV